MAAGVTKQLWEIGELVDVSGAWKAFGKQEREEACTYDTGSLSLPTARDVNMTPCGFGGYGL
jgi:hypothetical protein